jgi:hypothetical protein
MDPATLAGRNQVKSDHLVESEKSFGLSLRIPSAEDPTCFLWPRKFQYKVDDPLGSSKEISIF